MHLRPEAPQRAYLPHLFHTMLLFFSLLADRQRVEHFAVDSLKVHEMR